MPERIDTLLDENLIEGLRYRPPLRGPDGTVIRDGSGNPILGPPDPRYMGHAIKRLAQLGITVDPEAAKSELQKEIEAVTGTNFKIAHHRPLPKLPAVVDDEEETGT